MPPKNPYLALDDSARALAASLMQRASHAALAVIDPQTGAPNISRIAFSRIVDGTTLTLISALSAHTTALLAAPACAFLVGEPGPRGDPLTHPRLMVQAQAIPVKRDDPRHLDLRSQWLLQHPKAKLYIDFSDFQFVVLKPTAAVLNAGFGKAYQLLPSDFPV